MPSVLPEDIRFNPKIVIEFDNNRKASKILRDGYWNNDFGFIQNRKIMYEIDLFLVENYIRDKDYILVYKNSDITTLDNNLELVRREKYGNRSSDLTNFRHVLSTLKNTSKIKFKVDNYLNIECNSRCGNIYFCFNKIPFPEIAFTTNKLLNDIICSHDNSIIKFSKRENNVLSKDNDNYVLEKSKYFIPYNYEEVYNYFEGFRKLANWHHGIVNVDKQRIKHLESECKLDKKRLKN